ncbi:MAG: HPr family phosphocarrier protein [Selenomonadaceae bacterium]|nr:HPr family phosphocarrier protein [Selenomonadaceae bacterium]
MRQATITIENKNILKDHALEFEQKASAFKSEIRLKRNLWSEVDAKYSSSIGNMLLKEGDTVTILASGFDERDAVIQLKAFIESNFSYGYQYYCCCGKAYFELADYVAAIENCREAIKLNADNVYAHYILGLAHQKRGEYEPAIDEPDRSY